MDATSDCSFPPLPFRRPPPHLSFEPLQDIVSLLSFIVGGNLPCIAPTRLQSLPYCITIARPLRNIRPPTAPPLLCHTPYDIGDGNSVKANLAFTRCSFTSRLLCTNLTSLDPIRPSALATLLQNNCTTIGQYSTPSRPPFCMPNNIHDW